MKDDVVALVEAVGKVAPELCLGVLGPDGVLWAMTPAARDAGMKCSDVAGARRAEVVLRGLLCTLVAAPTTAAGVAWQTADVVSFHGLMTREPSMWRVIETIRRVARTSSTVLLRGESGTGKEMLALAVHEESDRRDGPFVAVNCASFTPGLLESELFGHVRGAFTGADRDRAGIFQRADRGTLFLDEVAEIPMELQGRLLRVLADRTFVPVGGTKAITVDVRIVSATHKGLREEVRAGRFREDLMYRLRVVPIFVPPLRERKLDVELLLLHQLDQRGRGGGRRIDRVAPEAMRALLDHAWPGNVRELINVVEHAMVMGEGPVLEVDDLPPELRESGVAETEVADAARIQEALAAADGDLTVAAARLGMSRTTLWRWRRRLGVRV